MDQERLETTLGALPDRSVAVVGDFCVDRYLDVDPEISDTSNETGLPIHQVADVRVYPGGGANVVNNLAALGVGEVLPVGFIGVDGEGFELRAIFESLGAGPGFLRPSETRHTPVYLKPVIVRGDRPPEEQNRFDIFPRRPLTGAEQDGVIADLRRAFERCDALIVADYGERGKYGTVSARVREVLAELARTDPSTLVLADSRLYIDKFRRVLVKPNAEEAMTFLGGRPGDRPTIVRLTELGQRIAERNQRPVIITLGPAGVLLCAQGRARKIPAYPSEETGEIDTVGAGDAVLASLAASLAAGASLGEAAVLAMVAASITIEQIGRCGTASPAQMRERCARYAERFPDVVET